MESTGSEDKACFEFGDRSTSDVVVRLRTEGGRDEWLYCHFHVLVDHCKYFAERLSEDWPTCQIIDSRNCVEVHCPDSEFDHHVTAVRLLYASPDVSFSEMWHGVKNALGILRAAHGLGCPRIVSKCVSYLEAVPWEEAEEEEILKTVPLMGPGTDLILSRLQPVDPSSVRLIFLSSVRFATSSPPPSMSEIKSSAQEQLEYMLTEDDDSPLLIADEEVKSEVRDCVGRLFSRFNDLTEALLLSGETEEMKPFQSHLSDLLWACQILNKLEIMRDFVHFWTDSSDRIVMVVENRNPSPETVETWSKVIEVASKVLEAIGYGTVILPTAKRLRAVKIWLPFVRVKRPLIDSLTSCRNDNGDDDNDSNNNNDDENENENKNKNEVNCETAVYKVDSELWQSLESTFVSMVLALPSSDQAEILTEWLSNEQVQYPDLTEAFEVWCYRCKVAKRRLSLVGVVDHETINTA